MRILVLLWIGVLALACSEPSPSQIYQTMSVERRDIVVSAQAAGAVEPDITVEVKSKASGEILEILVDTGELVAEDTLIVRIDQREPRNALAQAEAELEVALARLANAESQRRRSEKLFRAQSIAETARDQAVLDHANAKAEVVRARVSVENARIQMDDTDVRAPITGTIIEKHVERGQVISSPTKDVAGGTVLLKMADLSLVQVRTLVDETDIGRVHEEQPATVMVAAYPDRPFEGSVMKIEPQSVTEQNVTMFPVLVRVDNREGTLRPGMNCEVEILIDRRNDVLAVPNAALRTPRDLGSAAQLLGLPQEEVRQKLASRRNGGNPPGGRAIQGHSTGSGAEGGTEYIVFVLRDFGPEPAVVHTGLTDLDYSEVIDGLSEGDSVLILPSAGLVRSQEQFMDRIRRVRGDGLPGMRSSRP
jgi:HlyD family secretion protein